MVRSVLNRFFGSLNDLLQTPKKMIWVCAGLVMLNLVFDGSLLRLWSLYSEQKIITGNIARLKRENIELRERVKKAKDPVFLEREARDRFDLVGEGDLVFVFSEEEAP